MKKFLILLSQRGSNFLSLADACFREKWDAELVAVISDRAEAPGLNVAKARGIRTEVVDGSLYKSKKIFEAQLLSRVRYYRPDLLVLAGFFRILSNGFVSCFHPMQIVNIHPSLLPAFIGLDTHARALAAGVKIHGATVHFVTSMIDRGPIIVQVALPVMADDTVATLSVRVLREEHRIYPMAVRWILEDRLFLDSKGLIRVESNAGLQYQFRF